MVDIKISDMPTTVPAAGDYLEIYRPTAATSEIRAEYPAFTYQTVNEAALAAASRAYTITRTSPHIRVELLNSVGLSADSTWVLPTSPQQGDLVEVLRSTGGFFDWTNPLTGTVLGYRGDFVSLLYSGGAWHRVELRGRSGARRESVSRDLTLADNGAVISAVGTGVVFNVPLALGQSTGWSCELVQVDDDGVITVTLAAGLTKIGASSSGTNAVGQTLRLRALGNSEVMVQRLMTSSTPDGLAGWDATGGFDRLGVGSGLQLTGGVLSSNLPAASPPLPVVVTAAQNPFPLDATNRVSENKFIVPSDNGKVILFEMQNIAPYSEWALFRGVGHLTGSIHILTAVGAEIDGIQAVGVSVSPAAAWTAISGTNLTLTGTALPLFAAGTIFDVSHPTVPQNSGYYVAAPPGAPSATSMPCTKLSGSAPQLSASATVTIRERPVAATFADGRASINLAMPETGHARVEGEDTKLQFLGRDLDLNGHALGGAGRFTGTIDTNTVRPAAVDWTSLPQTVGPEHNGQIIFITGAGGTVTLPPPNTLMPVAGLTFACGFMVFTTGGVTFNGPSAIDQILVNGEVGALITRFNGTLRMTKAPLTGSL
jgi:hypothetical protein